jgi:hypothetical protein
MTKKANDYQNPNSTVRQADYYPQGIMTLLDSIHGKALRARSVAEAMRSDPVYSENFESIEDSFKDLIAYASFGVAWCRGEIEGQDPETGLFSNTLKGDKAAAFLKERRELKKKKNKSEELIQKAVEEIKKSPRPAENFIEEAELFVERVYASPDVEYDSLLKDTIGVDVEYNEKGISTALLPETQEFNNSVVVTAPGVLVEVETAADKLKSLREAFPDKSKPEVSAISDLIDKKLGD